MSEWWQGSEGAPTVPVVAVGDPPAPPRAEPEPFHPDMGECSRNGHGHTVNMIYCDGYCTGYPNERCSSSHLLDDLDSCPDCARCQSCLACRYCDYRPDCEHVWRCQECGAHFDEIGHGRNVQMFNLRQ